MVLKLRIIRRLPNYHLSSKDAWRLDYQRQSNLQSQVNFFHLRGRLYISLKLSESFQSMFCSRTLSNAIITTQCCETSFSKNFNSHADFAIKGSLWFTVNTLQLTKKNTSATFIKYTVNTSRLQSLTQILPFLAPFLEVRG